MQRAVCAVSKILDNQTSALLDTWHVLSNKQDQGDDELQ